jgi:hypothetical protein
MADMFRDLPQGVKLIADHCGGIDLGGGKLEEFDNFIALVRMASSTASCLGLTGYIPAMNVKWMLWSLL